MTGRFSWAATVGLLGCALLLAQPASAQQEAATKPQYSAEDFGSRPLMEQVQLSPDGKRFAAILNKGKLTMLVTRSTKGGTFQQVLATDNLEYLFSSFHWVNNERLVVSLSFPGERQVSEFRWAPVRETRLLAVNADGGNLINLVKRKANTGSSRATQQDDVVDWLPEDGQHVLMNLPVSDYAYGLAVFKVNVNTGQRSLYHDKLSNIYDWMTDQTHRVRVGIEYLEGKRTLWVCDPEGKTWRRLRSFGILDAAEVQPLGFGLDPDMLYVLAQHQGLRAVHKIDLRETEPQLQLVFAHPQADLGGRLIHDAKTGEAVGVQVSRVGNSGAYYWDESYKALLGGVDKALPQRANVLLQMLANGSSYLMLSEGNGLPGEFLLGERKEGQLGMLAERFPKLDPADLAPKRPITIKARDGLSLRGFLTLPKQREAKNLPLVLMPHGGPQSADTIRYEEWVAFLADRGYAVLQVNFRGSTGQGQAFIEKGLKRWGIEMQDDLTDAAQAMVERGIADRQRMAVVGASYGGYAALMAGVKTPDLFKGLMAVAPVTDLVELVREGERPWAEWRGYSLARQLGTLDADRERLIATSPRRQAEKIQVPVLLIHGTMDRSVDYQQSLWMAEALKKAGKPHRFITQDKGDHHLSHQPYRVQVLTEMEAFLTQVIGSGAPIQQAQKSPAS